MALFKRKMKYKINQGRSRTPQRARNVAISFTVLLVLLVGGGAVYTFITGKDEQSDTLAAVKPDKDKDEAFKEYFEPKKPVKGENVGASVQFLTTPVRPGNNASINVRTTATAKCSISVEYDDVESEDTGLVPKVADKYGMVKWTWTVDETAPKGTWPVWVKCKYGGKSGEVRGDLQVDPEAKVL